MGAAGVHPETGLTKVDFEEASIKRAVSRAAADTYVLASAENLNAASPYLVVDFGEVSEIITKKSVHDSLVQPYIERGLTIIRV
jgi:DeoR/GlpR family transcriptional regulator of sugar metabolism